MIYPAVVIDNTKFFEFGYIKIRTPKFHPTSSFNLKPNFPDSLTNTEQIDQDIMDYDIKAYLLTSMGGGRNYGLFSLPQIGTEGYVFFINEKRGKCVWLGNVFKPKYDGDGKVEHVNIPSDLEDDGEDTDGSFAKEKVIDGDEGTIIFRQKTTRLDTGDVNSIDMQTLPTENLFVFDKDRVQVKHFIRDEDLVTTKKQEFEINSLTKGEEFISLKINEVEISETKLTLNNLDAILSVQDIENETNSNIEITPTGVTVTSIGDETRSISIDNENGTIIINSNDTVTMTIDADGNVIFDGATSIQLNGSAESLVKYSDLKSIIDAFGEHIHVAPNGPTEGPLTSSLAPITTQINQPSTNMEATEVQTS